jgi:low temperature requirement protein LtrA
MTHAPRFRIRTRMVARDTEETERVSSPLELLFDLTFVVAVAQVSTALAHAIETGHGAAAILPFCMVFFAIWWAWMNFTWFASAYDTDDVPYRLLTLLQMGGVLVLAAGVPSAFATGNFFGITLGYFIMRIGLVAQWSRAAFENPDGRRTAARYAIGITVVQAGWLLRLLLPTTPSALPYTVYLAFFVLGTFDISVPFWAERTGGTNWHPQHIAERYGLFAIILLGESIASLAGGVGLVIGAGDLRGSLIVVGVASLVLVFALWWLYFLEPAGEGLELRRGRSYLWGYAHYFVFVALAALGGGLDVALAEAGGHLRVSPVVVAYGVAVPVAVYVLSMWAAHAPIVPRQIVRFRDILPALILLLGVPLLGDALGMPLTLALVVLVTVAQTVVIFVLKHRAFRGQP